MSVVHFALFYDIFGLIEFLNVNCSIEWQTVATVADTATEAVKTIFQISIFEQNSKCLYYYA